MAKGPQSEQGPKRFGRSGRKTSVTAGYIGTKGLQGDGTGDGKIVLPKGWLSTSPPPRLRKGRPSKGNDHKVDKRLLLKAHTLNVCSV